MPLVVLWVVRVLVVVDLLSLAPDAVHFCKLSGVHLVRPAELVLELVGDPASVDNDGSSFDGHGVLISECLLERESTSLVTVEWVDYFIALISDTIYVSLLGDEYFFGVIKLTEHEVRFEAMEGVELFIRHPVPSVVELLPWGNVLDLLIEPVVRLAGQNVLSQVCSVVHVGNRPSEQPHDHSAITH